MSSCVVFVMYFSVKFWLSVILLLNNSCALSFCSVALCQIQKLSQ